MTKPDDQLCWNLYGILPIRERVTDESFNWTTLFHLLVGPLPWDDVSKWTPFRDHDDWLGRK